MSSSSRFREFPDEQWARVGPLLPSNEGRQGRPFRSSRTIDAVTAITEEPNGRPRKSVGQDTPAERMAALLDTAQTTVATTAGIPATEGKLHLRTIKDAFLNRIVGTR